jgi:hypothetical protein
VLMSESDDIGKHDGGIVGMGEAWSSVFPPGLIMADESMVIV